MSIRTRALEKKLDRRTLVSGTVATAAFARTGRYSALGQEATPGADACAEPFDAARLGSVTMVSDGSPITVAIGPKLVHPFFEDCRIGAEETAGELGVTFEWVAPQTGDPTIQVKMIEDLISKQFNAVAISPDEPASVVPVINDGLSKGILMLTFDSDSPDSDRVMYTGTDHRTAGMLQGDTMREALGGSGRVGVITGGLGALNLNERIDGFRETVGPDIEIVEVVATDDDLQKGLGVSEALLCAHPNLNGIACVSATGGPTLAQVIQGPEFEGREIAIVAFDDLEETVRGIEVGIISATMVQRPVQMGSLSISQSYENLTQGFVPECALLDTGVTVVTLENLGNYTK